MSVSEELLCSFELLKPLDSSALKSHIKKGRNKRNSMLNSPVSLNKELNRTFQQNLTTIKSLLLYRRRAISDILAIYVRIMRSGCQIMADLTNPIATRTPNKTVLRFEV